MPLSSISSSDAGSKPRILSCTKSGIRIHTQIDIVTEIPVFYRITNAKVHDVNSMDWFTYEPLACYVFDRGYFPDFVDASP